MYISIANLAVTFVAVLFLFSILPESPKYLYANAKYDECREVLTTICRWNDHEGNGNELFR